MTCWSFGEARAACRAASSAQLAVEGELRRVSRAFAEADEAYRRALAREIVVQHDSGVAWSTAPDLARGDELVAGLRRDRDIADGVLEATKQAAWRAAADRKDAQRFADYSLRRDLMENGSGSAELAWSR